MESKKEKLRDILILLARYYWLLGKRSILPEFDEPINWTITDILSQLAMKKRRD